MKNLLKIIGIIAITTVIGFTMAACEEESTDVTTGKIIIGFFTPDYDGKFVKAEGSIPEDTNADPVTPEILIIAADTYNVGKAAKYGIIKNNSVSLSAWNVNGNSFSGDGVLDLTIYIYANASDTVPEYSLVVTGVSITGGKSTVNITGETFDPYVAP